MVFVSGSVLILATKLRWKLDVTLTVTFVSSHRGVGEILGECGAEKSQVPVPASFPGSYLCFLCILHLSDSESALPLEGNIWLLHLRSYGTADSLARTFLKGTCVFYAYTNCQAYFWVWISFQLFILLCLQYCGTLLNSSSRTILSTCLPWGHHHLFLIFVPKFTFTTFLWLYTKSLWTNSHDNFPQPTSSGSPLRFHSNS